MGTSAPARDLAKAAARRRTPARTGASSGYRSTGLGSRSSGAAAIHGVGQGGPRAAKTASGRGAAALARRARLRPPEGAGQALHEAPRGGHGGAPAGERGVREEDEGESEGGGEEQGGGVRPGCPSVAAPARPLMRAGSGGSKSSIWSSSPRSRSGQEDGERWRRNTGTSGLDRPRRAGCGLRRCKHGAGS